MPISRAKIYLSNTPSSRYRVTIFVLCMFLLTMHASPMRANVFSRESNPSTSSTSNNAILDKVNSGLMRSHTDARRPSLGSHEKNPIELNAVKSVTSFSPSETPSERSPTSISFVDHSELPSSSSSLIAPQHTNSVPIISESSIFFPQRATFAPSLSPNNSKTPSRTNLASFQNNNIPLKSTPSRTSSTYIPSKSSIPSKFESNLPSHQKSNTSLLASKISSSTPSAHGRDSPNIVSSLHPSINNASSAFVKESLVPTSIGLTFLPIPTPSISSSMSTAPSKNTTDSRMPTLAKNTSASITLIPSVYNFNSSSVPSAIENKTSVPLCESRSDGLIGLQTSEFRELNFDYEFEVMSNTTSETIEDKILPEIERFILESVKIFNFPECNETLGRKLMTTIIMGLTSEPKDIIIKGKSHIPRFKLN